MKNNTLLLLLVLASACHQPASHPQLSITDPHRQLATIPFDSVTTLHYQIINTGTGELRIDTVSASCGCTQPVIQKRVLPPGDSTELVVQYKPVDTGYFDKKVVIRSNIDSSFSVVSFTGKAKRQRIDDR